MEISENENKKRKRRNKILKALKKNSMEFCNHTSLHGLQYLGEPNRPLVERLFWLFTFITSLTIVTMVTMKVWQKWHLSPVFVSFADTMTPVWDIPFPAITICPQTKVRQTKFNFTHICNKIDKTDKEIEMFEKARLVCRNFVDFGIDLSLYFPLGYEPDNSTTVEGMIEFLEEVAPDVSDVITMCRWRGLAYNCSDLFKPVITDDGFCYTANTMNAAEMFHSGTVQREWNILESRNTKYWTFEDQYSDTESDDVYPTRAMTSGTGGGLLLMISLDKIDVDPLCSASVHGVKVVFNNPADYPAAIQDQYFRIPVDRDVVVGVKPRIMTTNRKLRSYSSKYRQCYFANEKYLRYFKIYTQSNCNLECFSNYTMKQCGCVAYYMPRTKDIPVCNIRKMNCTETTAVRFTSDDSGMEECGCLPSCTDIKYDVETSQAMFKVFDSFEALSKLSNALKINRIDEPEELFSMVSIFYKDNQFVTYFRSELYGTADFLASCGGLLGLYLGFSFLSLIEIIYFFTMRLISNFRASKKISN